MTDNQNVTAMLEDLVDLYNSDDVAAVVEKYWSSTKVTVNGHLIATKGEEVLAGELAVLQAAPDRKLRITNAVVEGRVVAVRATLSFTDRDSGAKRTTHWSAFWTLDENGSIIEDNAYFDPAEWPSP
jgi:predicted SnoaL-like aldol condensation-catalyzing enzyme